jgi:hypothetical protein
MGSGKREERREKGEGRREKGEGQNRLLPRHWRRRPE